MANDKKKLDRDRLRELIIPVLLTAVGSMVAVFGSILYQGIGDVRTGIFDLERLIRTLHPNEQGTINLLTAESPAEEVEVPAVFAALEPTQREGGWVASLSYLDKSTRETYYFDNLKGSTDDTAARVLSDCLFNAGATTVAFSAFQKTWQPPDYVDLRAAYVVTAQAGACRSALRDKLRDPHRVVVVAISPTTLSEFAKEFPQMKRELDEYIPVHQR